MDQHHKSAIALAAVPLVLGSIGLLIGHIHWVVLVVTILATAFVYGSALLRSRNAVKYGIPPRRY